MFNPEIEQLHPARLKELQLERLRWTVHHAYENNPRYRARFKASGFHPRQLRTLEDLQRIPFLTKQEMREATPYGLFAVPLRDVLRLHASSGTTGQATVVGYTARDLDLWATLMARTLACAGGTAEDVVQVAYGYGLFTGGLGAHYGGEKLGATVIPISGGNTERQLTVMQDFGTTMLACTPSYALNLAEHGDQMPAFDFRKTRLRSGVFGAEPWTEGMRQEIESRLGIDAYDIYGLSEVIGPGVSCECSAKQGLHVFEDAFLVEIIDPDTGEVLPEGSEGEIVFTSLTKECCPVIRYRSRDITRLWREPCPCGRTHVRMDKVRGRSDDMLIIRGVNVFPSQVEALLLDTAGLTPQYQIVVDRLGALDDMEVLVESPLSEGPEAEGISARVTARMKGLLGVHACITLLPVGALERSIGKARRVIDRRPQHLAPRSGVMV